MSEEITFDTEEAMEIQVASDTGTGIASFKDDIMSDVRDQGYYATFPVETMEDKKLLYRARNDNEMLKDVGDNVINLVGLVLDTAQINDEQVGAKTVPTVHLIDESGRVFQSSSSGVVTSSIKIISSFGMPETWDEALQIVCKETTTTKGFRYKYLSVL